MVGRGPLRSPGQDGHILAGLPDTNRGLPTQLTDLVPRYLVQVPQDPFDGQAIRYRRLKKGYVVYSIGRDLRDNNGQERARSPGGRPEPDYDITFIVEREQRPDAN